MKFAVYSSVFELCPLVSHCVDFCGTLVLALRKLLYTHMLSPLHTLPLHTPSPYTPSLYTHPPSTHPPSTHTLPLHILPLSHPPFTHTLPLHTPSLYTPSLYTYPHQFLLGGFYWIEAVALFEDIAGGLKPLNTTSGTRISGVDYYDPGAITKAYQNAAL